jgi:hypothetical protein
MRETVRLRGGQRVAVPSPLSDHPLLLAALRASSERRADPMELFNDIAQSLQETGAYPSKASAPPTQDFLTSYNNSVLSPLFSIIKGFERLTQSEVYLSQFPDFSADHTITRGDWLDYHLCQHEVTMAAIGDAAYLLTNAVLRLGLHPRHCTKDIIGSNVKIRVWGVKNALAELDLVVGSHRTRRNLLLHRGEIPSLDPTIESLFHRQMAALLEDYPPDAAALLPPGFVERTKELIDDELVEEAKRVIDYMARERDALESAVDALCDALLPRYNAVMNARNS